MDGGIKHYNMHEYAEMFRNVPHIFIKTVLFHLSILRTLSGSVKNYLFFIVLKSFKTLIYRRFANKKSNYLPFCSIMSIAKQTKHERI